MAAIAANAEEGLESNITYHNIWNNTPKPVSPLEAVASGAVKACLDMGAVALAVFADSMTPPSSSPSTRRPSPSSSSLRASGSRRSATSYLALVPMLLDEVGDSKTIIPKLMNTIRKLGIAKLEPGDDQADQVIVVERPGSNPMVTDTGIDGAVFKTYIVGDEATDLIKATGYEGTHTISFCSTRIGLENVVVPSTWCARPRSSAPWAPSAGTRRPWASSSMRA